MFYHGRDKYATKCGYVPQGNAGNAGEQYRRSDVDLRKSTSNPAKKLIGKINQAISDSTGIQQFTYQNKKWHCHKNKDIYTLKYLIRHDEQEYQFMTGDHPENGRANHRPGNRHSAPACVFR